MKSITKEITNMRKDNNNKTGKTKVIKVLFPEELWHVRI